MIKILIVGSSHVGSLKSGFDSLTLPNCYQIDYLALGAASYNLLSVEDGRICYPASLNEFIKERFGIVMHPVIADYKYIIYCNGPCRLSFSLFSANRHIPLLSSSTIRDIVNNIDDSLYTQICSNVSSSSVIYVGSPLKSESLSQAHQLKFKPLVENMLDISRAACLVRIIRQCCFASCNTNHLFDILLPPPHLLCHHQFNTLDKYIRGGLRLKGVSRSSDHVDMSHGNSAYGLEMSSLILEHIESKLH